MKNSFLLCLFLLIPAIYGCKDSSSNPGDDPNYLGGDTKLDYTEVGSNFKSGYTIGNGDIPGVYGIKDSITIIKNENGIVTYRIMYTLNEKQYLSLDTAFGTSSLPNDLKIQYINEYLKLFNGSVDTSDKQAIKVTAELKLRMTSEGIQDFRYSNGDITKPFIMVKYASNVGDKYEFTTSDNKKITRTVIDKTTVEDWYIGYLKVKTIKSEQVLTDDPINDKIVYICNHKYGLVGAILYLKDGRKMEYSLMPWN